MAETFRLDLLQAKLAQTPISSTWTVVVLALATLTIFLTVRSHIILLSLMIYL